MGTDFGNLIRNIGATAASASGKADKIDSKKELKEFVSGWEQIKAQAKEEAQNSAVIDLQNEAQTQEEIDALAKAELNSIMGLEFAKNDLGIDKKTDMQKGAAFSDEDLSLENMMALLDDEVAEYDAKGNPVVDQNGNPVTSEVNKEVVEKEMKISEMTHAGIQHDIAKEFAESGIDTHKLSERMAYITDPEYKVAHGAVDNALQFGDVSNIANFS